MSDARRQKGSNFMQLYRHLKRLGSLPAEIDAALKHRRLQKRIRTEDDRMVESRPLESSNWPVTIAALVMLFLGLFVALAGALVVGAFPDSLVSDFYANASTELVSIAATVLIVDRLNAWRLDRLEKERTLRQLSSRSNEFALDAVRVAGDHGWLFDGSLFNYELGYANLQNAPLDRAYLRSAHLFCANLKGAHLSWAYLKRAFMEGTNLASADLSFSNLQQAVLLNANLKDANLWLANLEDASFDGADLEGAILLQANMKRARLDGARLKNAIYDQYTLWPDDYDPVSNGATHHENDHFGVNPIRGESYSSIVIGEGTMNYVYKRPWANENESS